MNTISGAAAHRESLGSRIFHSIAAAVKRWVDAQVERRRARAAIVQLNMMSDRELSDIGIHRAEIEFAVTRGARDTRHGLSAGING